MADSVALACDASVCVVVVVVLCVAVVVAVIMRVTVLMRVAGLVRVAVGVCAARRAAVLMAWTMRCDDAIDEPARALS